MESKKAEVKKEVYNGHYFSSGLWENSGDVGQTEPIHSYKMNKFCGSNAAAWWL